jgi:hypothetical protein
MKMSHAAFSPLQISPAQTKICEDVTKILEGPFDSSSRKDNVSEEIFACQSRARFIAGQRRAINGPATRRRK